MAIVRQTTVRVLLPQIAGSGVIIAKRGKIYQVLTCDHVVASATPVNYQVLTADGRVYAARRLTFPEPQKDLAILEFESVVVYETAPLGDWRQLQSGDRLYAAGFPNYVPVTSTQQQNTRRWGNRAYRLTMGEFSQMISPPLMGGYRLGYTNDVEMGMSGGPVFNHQGELVAINGRLKFPWQGISAFIFQDGSQPSPEQFIQMEALSWAIPIERP